MGRAVAFETCAELSKRCAQERSEKAALMIDVAVAVTSVVAHDFVCGGAFACLCVCVFVCLCACVFVCLCVAVLVLCCMLLLQCCYCSVAAVVLVLHCAGVVLQLCTCE